MSAPTDPLALVTLDEVKTHLNIAATDTSQDAELVGFISAASVYVANLTGPVAAESFTEVHSGGRPVIFVWNPPILSVQSVVEYVGPTAYALTEVTLGDPTGQYSFSVDDPLSGGIRRRYTGGLAGNFMDGEANIAITYTGGRDTVPADVRMAILQDIAGLFQTSQLAPNPYFNNPEIGNAPLNPIGMFPRVEAILSAPARRGPAIA